MTNALRLTAACLLGAALVCGILIQFLPWKAASFSGGSFNASIHENLWGTDASNNGQGTGKGWYDGAFSDQNGITQIRLAIPFIVASVVAIGVGSLLVLLQRARIGGIVGLAGGVLLFAFAFVLLGGLDAFNGNGSGSLDTGAGTQMAFLGAPLAAAGGIVAFFVKPDAPSPELGPAVVPTLPPVPAAVPQPAAPPAAAAAKTAAPMKAPAKKPAAKKAR